MKKTIYHFVIAGIIAFSSIAEAAYLKAELIMPGGRTWKGQIVSRDGDWIEFSTGGNPIRIGISTINELVFDIRVDSDRLNQMNRNREYAKLISSLNRVLEPYAEYRDIPSNLTKYNALLMELHYKVGNYDKTLSIASEIVEDDRDSELQEKAQVYNLLALVESDRADEAKMLLEEYGWSELADDSSAEKLYIAAKLLALNKQYTEAIELAAKVVAFNSQDPDWMQPAELLCAEIYTEMEMYDSAEEVIRQISLLYKNTNENDLAQKLKIRIEALRAEQKLKKSSKSEEV